MKSTLSSSSTTASLGFRLMILFLFLLLLFSSANCRLLTHTLPSSTFSGNTYNPHHLSCDSFSKRTSRSLCYELQRIHHRFHKPVLPPSKENEIDARYGEEKRIVPSGPNPLHN